MTDTFTWGTHDTSGGGDFTINEAKFGDGYTQSVAIGINAEVQRWSVSTNAYEAEMRDDIVAFLRSHKGVVFYWTPPLGVQGYYVCKDGWKSNYQGGGLWVISLTFEQRFMP